MSFTEAIKNNPLLAKYLKSGLKALGDNITDYPLVIKTQTSNELFITLNQSKSLKHPRHQRASLVAKLLYNNNFVVIGK